MNIQRKNSAHHFRMQSEREQTLGACGSAGDLYILLPFAWDQLACGLCKGLECR